jgi:hypothetical protein
MCFTSLSRVTEGDDLDERREEHEEQSRRVAENDCEFLEQDGDEAAKGVLTRQPFLLTHNLNLTHPTRQIKSKSLIKIKSQNEVRCIRFG